MHRGTETNAGAKQSRHAFTAVGEVQARIISKAALMGSGTAPSEGTARGESNLL
jgi:hypothetical protein